MYETDNIYLKILFLLQWIFEYMHLHKTRTFIL